MKNNETEHIHNSAQNPNVIKNQAEHIQNSLQDTKVTNSQLHIYQIVRETPT